MLIGRNSDQYDFGIRQKAHQSLTRFLAPVQDDARRFAHNVRIGRGQSLPALLIAMRGSFAQGVLQGDVPIA